MTGGASPTPTEPTPASTSLTPPRLPRPPRQKRWWRALLVVATTGVLAGWLAWYVLTPAELPTDDQQVQASGVTGTPLYLGMFSVPDGFDRTLHIQGVKLSTTASTDLTVTPWLCQGGTVGVTTSPEQFCAALEDPAGAELSTGDSIVVEVSGEAAAIAEVDRIRIAFREDLRWGTHAAGHAGARVSLHPAGD
ncbi:hypothetical protein FXB39_12530 [Nocardioides sp. BGMRC 2183]|nr:hypothetical protein FXB39_12530 [Nocardioides sp. BGMRC 2183]